MRLNTLNPKEKLIIACQPNLVLSGRLSLSNDQIAQVRTRDFIPVGLTLMEWDSIAVRDATIRRFEHLLYLPPTLTDAYTFGIIQHLYSKAFQSAFFGSICFSDYFAILKRLIVSTSNITRYFPDMKDTDIKALKYYKLIGGLGSHLPYDIQYSEIAGLLGWENARNIFTTALLERGIGVAYEIRRYANSVYRVILNEDLIYSEGSIALYRTMTLNQGYKIFNNLPYNPDIERSYDLNLLRNTLHRERFLDIRGTNAVRGINPQPLDVQAVDNLDAPDQPWIPSRNRPVPEPTPTAPIEPNTVNGDTTDDFMRKHGNCFASIGGTPALVCGVTIRNGTFVVEVRKLKKNQSLSPTERVNVSELDLAIPKTGFVNTGLGVVLVERLYNKPSRYSRSFHKDNYSYSTISFNELNELGKDVDISSESYSRLVMAGLMNRSYPTFEEAMNKMLNLEALSIAFSPHLAIKLCAITNRFILVRNRRYIGYFIRSKGVWSIVDHTFDKELTGYGIA